METGLTMGALPLILGTLVAFVSGIWAIKVVIAFVQRGSLIWFASPARADLFRGNYGSWYIRICAISFVSV